MDEDDQLITGVDDLLRPQFESLPGVVVVPERFNDLSVAPEDASLVQSPGRSVPLDIGVVEFPKAASKSPRCRAANPRQTARANTRCRSFELGGRRDTRAVSELAIAGKRVAIRSSRLRRGCSRHLRRWR